MPEDTGTPMLTPGRLVLWLGELAQVAGGLVEAQVPGSGGIDARMREELLRTIAEANRCRLLGWVHESWQDFLGPTEIADGWEPLVDYARACAEAGIPLDATVLEAVFSPSVVRSTRATVARGQLGSLVGNTAGSLVTDRSGSGWRGLVTRVVAVGVSIPVLVPVAATAVALRLFTQLSPPVPEPSLPPDEEANLVVHLLADALPVYLGHAVARSVLLWSPVVLSIGVRVEGTDATLRIGQGRVEIVNGLRSDTLLVVEGGIESLLHLAAGSILRQMGVGRAADRSP